MDRVYQELLGKYVLIAFFFLIVISIIISYACYYMDSNNEYSTINLSPSDKTDPNS